MERLRVVRCNDYEKDCGRWYCLTEDNKRHYILSPDIALSYGDRIDTSNIQELSYKELCSYPLSFALAPNSVLNDSFLEMKDKFPIRFFWGSCLQGQGLEISPASNPWPVHLECRMEYTDPFYDTEEWKQHFKNKDFVKVDYRASLEDMKTIKKKYDFIVSSHVIEHTPRTILSIKNVYDHLKWGGVYIMAVPNMKYTFDCYRKETPLEHFIDDYYNYQRVKDVAHLVDNIENISVKYRGEQRNFTKSVEHFIGGENLDLHYHTFTESNMKQLLEWINNHVCKFEKIEIFNNVDSDFEFFVKLTKKRKNAFPILRKKCFP